MEEVKLSIERYEDLRFYEESYEQNKIIVYKISDSYYEDFRLPKKTKEFKFIEEEYRYAIEKNSRLQADIIGHSRDMDNSNKTINDLKEHINKLKSRNWLQRLFKKYE